MAFPDDPLVPEVGILIDGAWVDAVDVGNGIREADTITVTYGRANWSTRADPARASFTLDNRDGRWSPDNPAGAYAGLFRRNLPVRVGAPWGPVVLAPTGDGGGDMATTPTHASLDITGDIDVRVEFQATTQDSLTLAGRGDGVTGGWFLTLGPQTIPAGTVVVSFSWVDSGAGFELYDFDAPWSVLHDRTALRVTLDVSTGVGRLYLADAIDGTWVQYGADVTTAGATSIGTVSAALEIGNANHGVSFHALEVRDGIGGTVVANPDFTAQTAGASSFADAAGRTWTVGATSRLTSTRWRFHGELASIPTRWSVDGVDVTAPVEATGLLRRLRQNDQPLESAYRRAVLADADPFGVEAYWPLEESGSKAITRYGALVGESMAVTGGQTEPGRESGWLASSALPLCGDGILTGNVGAWSATGEWQVQWWQYIPTGTTSGTDVEVIRVTTGDATWRVEHRDTNGGDMRVIGTRGSTIYTSSYVSFNAIGQYLRCSLSIVDNGANVNVILLAHEPGGTPAGFTVTNAVAADAETVTEVRLNGDQLMDAWAVGHVVVLNNDFSLANFHPEAFEAWAGEKAANRVMRLCAEQGLGVVVIGDPTATEAMGPQPPGRLMDLLEECAATDLGVLHESRQLLALAYRTRESMAGQSPAVALDYAAGEVANSPELDRDDQGFANDITVTNWSGASTRAQWATFGSPVAVYEPPDGAGRYPARASVNLDDDVRLVEIAGAILDLSAVDEPRVSRLAVALHHVALAADPVLAAAVLDGRLGDLVTVDNNLTVALGSTQIRQILQGTRDTMRAYEWRVDMLTSPGSPWDDLLTAQLEASTSSGATLTATATGTFPEHVSTTNSATNTGSTSHIVSIGSTAAGDLLIALLFFNSDTTVTGPGDGWTRKVQNFGSPGTNECWMKIADGSDGATQTWTTSSSQAGAFQVLRISGTNGGIIEGTDFDFEVAAEFTSTTAPNPPSVTASWGSANNLFIAWTGYGGDNAVANAYPTDYDTNQANARSTNGGGGGGAVASASRQLASASDDPGAFTLASAEFGFVYTMVVRPA